MLRRLHVLLLRGYQRLPRKVRRVIIRWVAPSFNVGAMCVIERDDGALLLVRQSYRDHWGCPGGLLRRGEQPLDGAHRETEEEVGIAIEIDDEPRVLIDARARRIDVVFRCRVRPPVPEEIRPASAEIVEVRWFPPDRLPVLQKEVAEALAEIGVVARGAQRPGRSAPST
jgi:ADP-ribose pyrophosphatase YjhB (NUDIX family)